MCEAKSVAVGREAEVLCQSVEGALLRTGTRTERLDEDVAAVVVRAEEGEFLAVFTDGEIGIGPPAQAQTVVSDVWDDKLVVLLVGDFHEGYATLLGNRDL